MEHEYLTTTEVAEMLKVSPSTVSRWRLEGRYEKKYLRRTCGDAKGSKLLIHRDALKPKPTQQRHISQEEYARRAQERTLELLNTPTKKDGVSMWLIKWYLLLIVLFASILSAYIYSSAFIASEGSVKAEKKAENDTAISPPWYNDIKKP